MKRKIFLTIIIPFFLLTLSINIVHADDLQNDFLKEMADGLNARFEMSKNEGTSISEQEFVDSRMNLVNTEYDKLSPYIDVEFENETFSLLAHAYIEGLELQRNALKYYLRYQNIYDIEWDAGYNKRAIVISAFYDYYGLDIPQNLADEFKNTVNNLYTYSYEIVTTTEETETETKLESEEKRLEYVSFSANEEYDYYRLTCKVKNISDIELQGISLNTNILDSNGDILTSAYFYFSGTVNPDQSVNLETTIEKTGAYSLEFESADYSDNSGNYLSEKITDFERIIIENVIQHSSNETDLEMEEKETNIDDIDGIVDEILSYKNGEIERAWELITDYNSDMSEEQIKSCLVSYGRWKGLDYAEDKIKENLKSPRSYYRYEGSSSNPEEQDDGTYKTEYTLKYGATNSFGAEVTDTVTVYVYFTIDIESVNVSFVETKLSAYDAFRYSQG